MSDHENIEPYGRTLIHIPVIYTQADMGALSESVQRQALENLGLKGWERKVTAIDEMWTVIKEAIEGLKLPYEKVRLYQDSLPVCGREFEIVRDLARGGSRNHQLLLRLMAKGGRLMGTESLELLMEEYELARQLVAANQGATPGSDQQAASASLLKKRDQFIAHRINSTLKQDEIGILLLGMLHCIESELAEDIRVIYPVNRPCGGGANG